MTASSTGIASSVVGTGADNGSDTRPARLLAWLGIGGALTAIALVGALHVLPQTSGVDPIRRTISEYALSSIGWVFNIGVLALALGSIAIAVALVLTGLARAGSVGVALLGVWSAALLVIILFPKHNWAVGPSANGQIHRVASIVAFLALPVAVLLLTRRAAGADSKKIRRPAPARAAFWLGVLSLAWFTPILGALLLAPVTRTPWWQAIPLGLVERGLVISEVLAVIALGKYVLHEASLSETKRPLNPLPASPARTAPTA